MMIKIATLFFIYISACSCFAMSSGRAWNEWLVIYSVIDGFYTMQSNEY